MLKEGQTVQFHLRDAETSSQDLSAMLEQYASGLIEQPAGALLFQCLGRGSYLYGRPDHDTDMFGEMVGGLPLTGFFCNGEIGPGWGCHIPARLHKLIRDLQTEIRQVAQLSGA